MERLAKRGSITLAIAFLGFPLLITLGLEPANLGELLAGMVAVFFIQFTIPWLWLIPLAFGAVAGLLWHGIAELVRREDETAVD